MSHLYKPAQAESQYARKNWQGTYEEYQHALDTSTTVYVGNLSFYTREEQIWELFSKVGEVKRIVMGLNKYELTPCGFCFVEYYTHEAAADCVNYVSGTKLDERVIRADWDTGFVEGRQFGRGSTGGQIRDEFRDYYDPERGDRRPRPSPNQDHHSSSHAGHSSHRGANSSHPGSSQHHSPRHHSHPSSSERAHSPATGGRVHSPAHDRHSREQDSSDYRRDRDDRHASRRDRNDDYHHRDRRDYHRDSYERDYHDSPNSYRSKRGRDDYEQRHSIEPMVDEFGRDIPAAKRPKYS